MQQISPDNSKKSKFDELILYYLLAELKFLGVLQLGIFWLLFPKAHAY